MKNQKGRWAALLLACLLAFGMAGCGQDTQQAESESNTTQQTQEQTESQQTEETAETETADSSTQIELLPQRAGDRRGLYPNLGKQVDCH